MKVERTLRNESVECFKISAGATSVLVQTNRRMLVILGKKKDQPRWDIVNGKVSDRETFEETINKIQEYMKEYEIKYPGYTSDTYGKFGNKK